MLAVDADPSAEKTSTQKNLIRLSDAVVCTIFLTEVLLRWFHLSVSKYFKDGWNVCSDAELRFP